MLFVTSTLIMHNEIIHTMVHILQHHYKSINKWIMFKTTSFMTNYILQNVNNNICIYKYIYRWRWRQQSRCMWLCCNSERKDEQWNLCARCLIRASYKMSLGPANVLLNDDDFVVGYLLCNAHIALNNLYYY